MAGATASTVRPRHQMEMQVRTANRFVMRIGFHWQVKKGARKAKNKEAEQKQPRIQPPGRSVAPMSSARPGSLQPPAHPGDEPARWIGVPKRWDFMACGPWRHARGFCSAFDWLRCRQVAEGGRVKTCILGTARMHAACCKTRDPRPIVPPAPLHDRPRPRRHAVVAYNARRGGGDVSQSPFQLEQATRTEHTNTAVSRLDARQWNPWPGLHDEARLASRDCL